MKILVELDGSDVVYAGNESIEKLVSALKEIKAASTTEDSEEFLKPRRRKSNRPAVPSYKLPEKGSKMIAPTEETTEPETEAETDEVKEEVAEEPIEVKEEAKETEKPKESEVKDEVKEKTEEVKEAEEKPAKPKASKKTEVPAEAPSEVTRDEVLSKLKKLANSGKATEVKELLNELGFTKFSEVSEDKLTTVMAKAEKL